MLYKLNIDHLGITSTFKMAAEVHAGSFEQQAGRDRKCKCSLYIIPKDTLDQPCDVVLMVKDVREFKDEFSRRSVLSLS